MIRAGAPEWRRVWLGMESGWDAVAIGIRAGPPATKIVVPQLCAMIAVPACKR